MSMVRLKLAYGYLRTVHLLVLIAVLALPLQHLLDGISASASIFSSVKVALKTALPKQTDQIGVVSATHWHDEGLKIPIAFLRFDYKQNLLRWPVVAGDITRSPPFLV